MIEYRQTGVTRTRHRQMDPIFSSTVYVWCESRRCVGAMCGNWGCGTTMGGNGVFDLVLAELLK